MTKREIQREQALKKIATHILRTGLAQTSVRQLADAAGVSDRMLLYYFTDKTDLLAAALERIAVDLSGHLAKALPENDKLAPGDFAEKATALIRTKPVRRFLRLWIDIAAASGRGEEPYAAVAKQIALGFHLWIETRLDIKDAARRRSTAAMILVLIDGMALLEACSGEEIPHMAADAMIRTLSGKDRKGPKRGR